MKSSDYIADYLSKQGIHDCYGYQGTMIAHLVDSICAHPAITNHVCYNEQAAAFAAVGQAKVTGELTMAYATSGPGAMNLISGIADAYYDSAPVLFITGQLNTYEYLPFENIRQHGFQETDVVSAVRAVTKYSCKVEKVEDLPMILEEACRAATTGRKGPAVIDLPMNMQRLELDADIPSSSVRSDEDAEARDTLKAATTAILSSLDNAERPVLLLGNGIRKTGREDIRRLVDTLGIPVVTSTLGRDILPYAHPLNFGFIGAAYGHRYANIITHKKADLIISLGCSLCKRQTGMKPENFASGAKIIRVDIDPTELARKVHEDEASFLCDCNQVISELLSQAETSADFSGWLAVCQTIRKETECFDQSCPERKPNHIIELISDHTHDVPIVACDVGQHQMWCAQSYHLSAGQMMISSGGHGAMGFSVPAAIGAHFARGERTLTITGDGAMQMNIQELQWIAREQLPITIFVMNNNALGLICQQQDDIFEGRYYASYSSGGYTSPNFAEVAAAYGIKGQRANSEEELEEILKTLDYDTPNLVEVLLESNSRAYPKTYFGEEMHNQRPYLPEELLKRLLDM